MTVEVDVSDVVRGMRQLARGLDERASTGARSQAAATAAKIRQAVPVRTGALRASVTVVPDGEGFGVTYGSGLRYAGVIERRKHPVAQGVEGAPETFHRAMQAVARVEVDRL